MIRIAIVAISLFLLLLFFCWGTAGNFLLPFTIFFPQFHVIFGAVILASIILGREYTKITPFFEKLEEQKYIILPVSGFLIAVLINFVAFDNIPHVQDGIHYKYMAETFAGGKFSQDMPVHYEFFEYPFFIVDGKRHFSLFMPGFPIFLMPFALFGLTFLANPLLTAINILLIGRFSQYLFGHRTSTYAMLLFVISPFMMTVGGTWMAHPFTAMLTIIAVFSFCKFWETRALYLPVVSGAAVAWMILTRPPNALFYTILLFLIGFFRIKHKVFIKGMALFSAPIIIGVILVLAYNNHFTGNPFIFIQDIYFNVSEPVNDCHNIGLSRGCQHCNGESLPFGGMTWQHGVKVTMERVIPLVMETFPHPLIFGMIIWSLMITLNNQDESRKKILLVFLFLVPLIGYFLFYFNGNVFGPRYLYEGTIFLIIVAASGIVSLFSWLEERKCFVGAFVVASFLVGSVLFEIVFTMPKFVTIYQNTFWGVEDLLKEKVEQEKIERSVIFVDAKNEDGYGSGLVAMNLGEFERNSNIFVRDLGDEANSKYMHYMKGRDFYRVRTVPWRNRPLRLQKIHPVYPEGYVHVEFEDKFLPFLGKYKYPDYCNKYPIREDIYPYVEFSKMTRIGLSKHEAMYCRFVDHEQSYRFGQYFPENGVYSATIASVSGAVFGDLDVFMDGGHVASINLAVVETYGLNEYEFELLVSKGLHTFDIAVQEDSLPERNYFMIDFIRFERSTNDR